jgi:hypothetical protein
MVTLLLLVAGMLLQRKEKAIGNACTDGTNVLH